MFLSIGGRIGYFQGDPRKLVDDIGELRPTIFLGAHRGRNPAVTLVTRMRVLFKRARGLLRGCAPKVGCQGWSLQATAFLSAHHGCNPAVSLCNNPLTTLL